MESIHLALGFGRKALKLRPEDIPALIRKARRFLEAADRDIRAEDYTSAPSRMYYAMFHGAQAILLAKGFRFSSHIIRV
ncbi:HEPN domain-containing protein [Thermoflexus hugenholtzii]|uniref:HEPN domain-containing protein n=1 Tax=Thermoflexus hugenholtzii TaxID=1495650 RepID=UPI000B50EBDB